MFNWLIHRLASVLPPAIDSSSEQMRFSTTQKRFFLRETRSFFARTASGILSAARAYFFWTFWWDRPCCSYFVGPCFTKSALFIIPALPQFDKTARYVHTNEI